jgi:hypothetical protein
MAITMTCPRCTHKNTFDDAQAKQQVHCRICHFQFVLNADAPAKVPPPSKSDSASKPTAPKAVMPPKAPTPVKGDASKAPTAKALPVPSLVLDPEPAAAAQDNMKAGPPPLPRSADGPPDLFPPSAKRDSRRDSRYDDEDDRPRRSRRPEKQGGSSIFLWLAGGFAVLLGLGCCVSVPIVYLMFKASDQVAEIAANAEPPGPFNPPPDVNRPNFNPPNFNPPNFNPPPPPPQRIQLNPNDPAEAAKALAMLPKGGEDFKDACRWLRQADVNNPSRDEIARQLDKLVEAQKQAQFRHADFFEAYFRWATKDNVDSLIKMVEDTRFGGDPMNHRHRAMETLGKLKEPRAAELILQRIADVHDRHAATKGLELMGDAAQPTLAKHMNDANRDLRRTARELLQRQNALRDALITQTIADLNDADLKVREAAVEWLAQGPVDEQRRKDVARALDPLITAESLKDQLLKAVDIWGTEDNAMAVAKSLNTGAAFHIFRDQVKLLARFKDEKTIPTLANHLGKPGLHGMAAQDGLKEFGKAAEPAMLKLLLSNEKEQRLSACRVLGAVGTVKVGLPALQKARLAFQNDFFFRVEADNAMKAIVARGAK